MAASPVAAAPCCLPAMLATVPATDAAAPMPPRTVAVVMADISFSRDQNGIQIIPMRSQQIVFIGELAFGFLYCPGIGRKLHREIGIGLGNEDLLTPCTRCQDMITIKPHDLISNEDHYATLQDQRRRYLDQSASDPVTRRNEDRPAIDATMDLMLRPHRHLWLLNAFAFQMSHRVDRGLAHGRDAMRKERKITRHAAPP